MYNIDAMFLTLNLELSDHNFKSLLHAGQGNYCINEILVSTRIMLSRGSEDSVTFKMIRPGLGAC